MKDRLDRQAESLSRLEGRMDRFGEIGTERKIRGAAGVSRRYAYDLMDAMATEIDGIELREAKRVQTGNGTKRKRKALLIDCERVHWHADGVNQFTTGGAGTDEG